MDDHAATGHGDGHDGHGAAPLGAPDWRAWGAGLLGVAIGLLTVAIIARSVGAP